MIGYFVDGRYASRGLVLLNEYLDYPTRSGLPRVVTIGINFSSEERKVVEWKVETLVPRSSCLRRQ